MRSDDFMKKKLLLIILCGVCLIGVTGCGTKKDNKMLVIKKQILKLNMLILKNQVIFQRD